MKLPILFLGLVVCAGAAFADEAGQSTQKLVERKTCAEIKAEIANLSAIENPDEETLATLKQLQSQHRSSCVIKSAGRRTVVRNYPTSVVVKNVEKINVTTSDALKDYLDSKKANCDKLNSEIEKLAAQNDESKSNDLASMRGVYDMDCAEKPKAESAPAAPEKTEEELAAEFDANLAAGLCGDGTKPNRFGCCTGETFKDLGNTVFACCPKEGGLCFPPIK